MKYFLIQAVEESEFTDITLYSFDADHRDEARSVAEELKEGKCIQILLNEDEFKSLCKQVKLASLDVTG